MGSDCQALACQRVGVDLNRNSQIWLNNSQPTVSWKGVFSVGGTSGAELQANQDPVGVGFRRPFGA